MKKSNKGFTIVELVIVIAVIAILAGVLIPTFSNVVANANQSAALQTARSGLSNAVGMTNTASLPGMTDTNEYQTVFFVDYDKKGYADYAFGYSGNSLTSIAVAGTANNSKLNTANYNSIFCSTKSVSAATTETYIKVTITESQFKNDDVTYYTKKTESTTTYEAVSSTDSYSSSTEYFIKSSYKLTDAMTKVIQGVCNANTDGTTVVTVSPSKSGNCNYVINIQLTSTASHTVNVYTNSDFASNLYVFTKLA